MTNYYKKFIQIDKLIINKILLGQKNIHLCLSLKKGEKVVIFDLINIFFFLSSLSSLVSLGLFNNYKILYNNENKILYNKKIKSSLAYI